MKLSHPSRILGAAILSSVILLALAPKSHAQTQLSYYVSLNVGALNGNSNGPFSLDLQLTSGAVNPDSDNTVTLSNFVVTGGALGAATYSNGGETGTMNSSVTLTTSSEDNELAQLITGNPAWISFKVTETLNSDNPAPDQFDVSILDSGLGSIQTTDPTPYSNTLVLSTLGTADTLSSVDTYQSTSNGEAPAIEAYVGTSADVPEPATTASLLGALGGMAMMGFRKRRRN